MPRKPDGLGETSPGSEYAADEVEFLMAVEAYKRNYRRPFPTWTEVLKVLKSLGYRKVEGPQPEGKSCPSSAASPPP